MAYGKAWVCVRGNSTWTSLAVGTLDVETKMCASPEASVSANVRSESDDAARTRYEALSPDLAIVPDWGSPLRSLRGGGAGLPHTAAIEKVVSVRASTPMLKVQLVGVGDGIE